MSDAEVGRIIDCAVAEDEDAPKPVIHFERGEEIRIIDGPFASMMGKVEEVNQTRSKLTVMVNIFGRPTSVELDFTQVERLS
jgi:transcriptional antiterminator NusG